MLFYLYIIILIINNQSAKAKVIKNKPFLLSTNEYAFIIDLYRGGGIDETKQQSNDDSGVNVIDNDIEDDDIVDGEYRISSSNNSIVVEELVSVDDDDNKLKEQGVGDPSDSDNDDLSDDISDLSDDDDKDEVKVKSKVSTEEYENHVVVTTEEIVLSNENNQTKVSIEEAISNALEMILHVPPSQDFIANLQSNKMNEDIASRKRLDRRTLYRMLLLELLPASNETNATGTTKRKFLNDDISASLHAAISLASQPKWRKHVTTTNEVVNTESTIFYNTNNIKLYPDDYSNNEDKTTMSMQETIAMAVAHSLNMGFVILDDKRISYMKQYILNHTHVSDTTAPELKTSFILQSIIGILNKGFTATGKGSLSSLMKEDYDNHIDNNYDELANLSYTHQVQDEIDYPSSSSNKPLSCLFFIRTNDSSMLLRSKSSVDVVLKEMSIHNDNGRHLFALGKNMDIEDVSSSEESSKKSKSNWPSSTPFFGQQQPSPFYQMNQDIGSSSNTMNNASGQNDPEGSKRVNIFLARTIDPDGNPGIIGTIAPPAAGNIFPQMLAMHQQRQAQEGQTGFDGLSSGGSANNGFDKLFFNTSLSSDDEQKQQQPMIPPELLQRVIQQAITQMIEQLSQLPEEQQNEQPYNMQQEVIKYFSEMLQNEHLKRSVTDNLIRAAPALLDPRCQGIMLSVYIPPGNNHPNRGMMPSNTPLLSNKQDTPSSGGGWWNKILQPGATTTNSSQQIEQTTIEEEPSKNHTKKASLTPEAKQRRGLLRLSSHTQTIPLSKPIDQVRSRSWDAWLKRQIHCIYFTQNVYKFQVELQSSRLKLRLDDCNVNYDDFYRNIRSLLSMRDIGSKEMKGVVKSIIEFEAAKSQRGDDSFDTHTQTTSSLASLSKLFNDYDIDDDETHSIDYIHPTTIETVLSQVCQSFPITSSSSLPSSYRTREEISSLAQDKHERALVNNVVLPQDIGINYDMIGGLNDVKELLRQSITYPLKYPHLYSEGIAREAVKGVLLFGPPGTGKTMLAKAVATEGGATFLSIDASSVENKWLGESEKNAKAVFTLARRLAPCVIFLDEVDSLLSSREGSGSDDSAHGTLTSVKTTMMSEWDGLNSATSKYSDNRVIVIGSTNRPYDLDEAVLRRFPRRILVDLPDLDTRREILEVTLAENRIDASVNFTSIAELLDGYTGSDIKEVCREAVVQISHEQARLLDSTSTTSSASSNTMMKEQRLRPATLQDFEKAIRKLKKSVSTKGKELTKVLDWNEEYGEIKNTNRKNRDSLPQVLNMFL